MRSFLSKKVSSCSTVMVNPALRQKTSTKKHPGKMVIRNIGNFGRKVSEYNAQRRDRNLEKLRVKAANAEEEKKKLEEAKKLKGQVQETKDIKKEMNKEKLQKAKDAVGQLKKVGGNYENKSGNKLDVLGNNNPNNKKELPDLFGNKGKGGGNFKL